MFEAPERFFHINYMHTAEDAEAKPTVVISDQRGRTSVGQAASQLSPSLHPSIRPSVRVSISSLLLYPLARQVN